MKRPAALESARLAALAAVIAGLCVCAWSLARTPDRRRILEAKIADLDAVEREADRVRQFEPLWAALETLPAKTLRPPAQIWSASGAPGVPEVTLREPVSLKDGWTARRADVVTGDLPADALFRFLEACESNRPPWRPVDLRLDAADAAGGRVRARMTLEGLEQAETR